MPSQSIVYPFYVLLEELELEELNELDDELDELDDELELDGD